ncbi:MAG: hypothetical protein ABFD54_00280 [Armatimonadota bacterium]|nr:hypothetical protein [bacterium]
MTYKVKEILRKIEIYMSSQADIPLDDVRSWMHHDSIDVIGAVADIVTYLPYYERVRPPLPQEELEAFLFKYYERCLREDPKSEWAASRYAVGQEITGWFTAVPKSEDTHLQTFLLRMKHWMSQLYLAADSEVRNAIVTGALEHILEEPRWREFFLDWRNDPNLSEAYDQAIEWAVEHER